MNIVKPIVLCGGSGTRLWPLSRKALPKQFAPLIGNKSLLQLTLERLGKLNTEVTCVAAESHRFLVQDCVDAAGVTGRQFLEPVARNTAAAMAFAALMSSPDDLLLFAPADHHIPDSEQFAACIHAGTEAANAGWIVTFGVVPTFPSTAYGYIHQGLPLDDGASSDGARKVRAFVEKPDAATATALLLKGDHLWNAGLFLVRASTLLEELDLHSPDILAACQRAVSEHTVDGAFVRVGRAAFEQCRSQSIDYAVLEHSKKVAVLPFSGAWSDVGSWNSVAALHIDDADGNRINGNGFVMGASNTFVHAPSRPVVALGTQDLLIVDSQDALLVAHKDCAEQVKDVVSLLSREGHRQATQHRRTPRPWGAYDDIDGGEHFAVKRLTVKPLASLALRMHRERAEHWVVVSGTAKVIRDGSTVLVEENESIYIPPGTVYRLENPSTKMLEVVEIQTGERLLDDDIVRFDAAGGELAEGELKFA